MEDDLELAQKNMLHNMNLNHETTSDLEMDHQSGDDNNTLSLPKQLQTDKKKNISMILNANTFDIGSLAQKLEEHLDE